MRNLKCFLMTVFLGVILIPPAFCPPPSGRQHLFFDFLVQKITVPQYISGPTNFPEDISKNYQGAGETFLSAAPGTPYSFWFDWGNSEATYIAAPFDAASHQWYDSGVYTIRLMVQYTKRTGGVDVPNTIEEIARLAVIVSAYDAQPGGTIYFAVQSNSGTNVNEGTLATFTAVGAVDYVQAIPERTANPDFYNGARPGSVQYRWKIVRPTGYVEYEDPSWTTIPGRGNTVSPVCYSFPTPFDPEKYSVILQVKYREQAWKPIYYLGVITGWEDDPTYQAG